MTKPLRITLLAGVVAFHLAMPASGAAQYLTLGGNNSNYGSTSLAPGFTPDPVQVGITSGGSLSVPNMNLGSGCVGYATSTPDYIVYVTGQMNYLSFYNEGTGDTGLVINDPNGNWHCDDDSRGGTNPMVALTYAQAGQYDIWVTSYSAGQNVSGTLSVTERR